MRRAVIALAIVIGFAGSANAQTTRKVYAGGTTATGDATYPGTSAGLQEAIDDAAPGDTILVQNDLTFSALGGFQNGIVLGAKTCAAQNDTCYITISGGIDSTGALAGTYPAAGVRVTTAHTASLPTLVAVANNGPAMRTVWPSEVGTHCAAATCLGNYWKLTRLHFKNFAPWNAGAMLILGTNNAPLVTDITNGDNQNLPSEIPHHIIVDQVLFTGDPIDGQHRALTVAAKNVTVQNSYFKDIKSTMETQAISVVNTVGPVTFRNNYIEGSGENFMTGGGDGYGIFAATITGSPTPTSATLSLCTELGTTANHHWFSIEVGAVEYFRMIDTINTSTCAITWTDALPAVPDVPGNVQWSWTLSGLLFEKNYVYKPPAWRNPIQAGPTGVIATPFTTGGTLAAGEHCYRVQSRQNTTNNVYAQSSMTPEVCATTTGSTGRVDLSWTASANADEYRIFDRFGNSTRMTATVTAPTVTYSHTSPTAGTPVAGTPRDATVTAFSTGGSLPAGTYRYRIIAYPAAMPPTDELVCTIATGVTTGRCDFSWTPVTDTTGYRIYGRGSFQTLYLCNGCTGGVTTTGSTYSDISTASTFRVNSDIFPADKPTVYIVKNTFELKNCDGLGPAGACIVRGNRIEGSWTQAQTGMVVNIKTNNQNFNDDSAVLRNTLFEYNDIRSGTRGIQICAYDCDGHGSGRMEDLTIRNNLFSDIGTAWGDEQSWIYLGAGYNVGAPPNRGGQRFTFDHNTVLGDVTGYGPLLVSSESSPGQILWTDLKWTNNVTRRGDNGWHALHNGSFGTGGEGTTAFNNAVNGSNRLMNGNVWSAATLANYPDVIGFAPDETAFQACFTNYATGDYSLAPACPWNNAGTDTLDIGADVGTIATYTAIAVSGDDSGAPPAVTITSASPLPNATIGSLYSTQLSATGGAPPYTWTITSGALPTGLTLSTSGLISGTPTGSAGTVSPTFRATGTLGSFDEDALSLTTVAPGGGGGGPQVPTFVASVFGGASNAATATSTTPLAVSGTDRFIVCALATQLQSRTGTSVTFNATTPQSLTLIGWRDFDNAGLQARVELWTLVNPAAETQTITANWNLSTAIAFGCGAWQHVDQVTPLGTPVTAGASSNAPSVTVTSVAGKLVIDLVSVRTGTTGMTEGAGQTNIVEHQSASGVGNVTVLMSQEPSATSTVMSWTVDDSTNKSWASMGVAMNGTSGGGETPDPLAILTTVIPYGVVGDPYSFQLEADGGTPPYTWARISGDALPQGITLSTGGLLSGTPKTSGESTFTLRVTDSAAATLDQQYLFGRIPDRPQKTNQDERNIYYVDEEPSLFNGRLPWEGDIWIQPSTNTMRVMRADLTWAIVGVGRGEQPTCSASLRGVTWYVEGADLAKDSVVVCAKDASNVYAWRTIY